MTKQHEIEALTARLMKAESEVAAMREERTKVDIRAEVEKRGGTDHEAISALISKHTRKNDEGTLCAIDETGAFRYGSGSGAYMPVWELLDELKRQHGCFFQGKAAPSSGAPVATAENPFAPGPGFNLTAQMVMLRNDPERAEHLQYVASLGRA